MTTFRERTMPNRCPRCRVNLAIGGYELHCPGRHCEWVCCGMCGTTISTTTGNHFGGGLV